MNFRFRMWLIMALTLPLAAVPGNMELSKVLRVIDARVNLGFHAYQDLRTVTTRIGHRLTGSDNGRQAETHVYELLKAAGLDSVQYQPFTFPGWFRGKVSLRELGESGKVKTTPIPVVALSASPTRSHVEAELVDVGSGLKSDFLVVGNRVRGRVALAYLGVLPEDGKADNIHRSEKVDLAVRHGARGVIFYNRVPGGVLLTGTASITGELISIPAVCVDREHGMALRKRMKAGESIRVRLEMENRACESKARNVIATLRGREIPEEVIVVGAHLDSWDLATGAIDNGIGAFAVVDAARQLAAIKIRPRRSIEFVLFMGEEQGILGSRAFVHQAVQSGKIKRIRWMLNMDMSGNPVGFSADKPAREGLARIGSLIQSVDPIFLNKFRSGGGIHGDGRHFLLHGIPVMGMISNLDRGIYRFYHSNRDSFDLVNRDHLLNSVRFTAMTVFALADIPRLPQSLRDDHETRDLMVQRGYRESLERSGDWRWETEAGRESGN